MALISLSLNFDVECCSYEVPQILSLVLQFYNVIIFQHVATHVQLVPTSPILVSFDSK